MVSERQVYVTSGVQSSMNGELADGNIILIVDDNPANLGLLSDLLDDAGFEVWVARDGESAIRKVEYAPPDIILLDVMMPDLDGYQACRCLKADERTRDIPIIFITAYNEFALNAFKLNSVDYLLKPLNFEDLKKALDKFIKTKENYLKIGFKE